MQLMFLGKWACGGSLFNEAKHLLVSNSSIQLMYFLLKAFLNELMIIFFIAII